MANSVSEVLLTETYLEMPAQGDVRPAVGALVDFWGIVRETEDGRTIEGIDYEAHAAMARHQMKLIADAAVEKFGLDAVVLHHRVGFVRAGEASLFLRASAAHRAEAFDASKWIVDELKKRVPIWKRPAFTTKRVSGTQKTPVRPGS
jgi:molybdopterin synthase catalytic subunit